MTHQIITIETIDAVDAFDDDTYYAACQCGWRSIERPNVPEAVYSGYRHRKEHTNA